MNYILILSIGMAVIGVIITAAFFRHSRNAGQ